MPENGRGRPTKLTPELQNKIVQLIAAGNYVETAAAANGINKTTLYDWMRRGARYDRGEEQDGKDPADESLYLDFSNAVEKAQGQSEATDVLTISKAAKEGVWQAAAWRLERKFPNRYGRKDKTEIELGGKGEGGAIEVVNTNKEQLGSRIARLVAASGAGEDTGEPDGDGSGGAPL